MTETNKRYVIIINLEKSKDEVYKFIENYTDMQIKLKSRLSKYMIFCSLIEIITSYMLLIKYNAFITTLFLIPTAILLFKLVRGLYKLYSNKDKRSRARFVLDIINNKAKLYVTKNIWHDTSMRKVYSLGLIISGTSGEFNSGTQDFIQDNIPFNTFELNLRTLSIYCALDTYRYLPTEVPVELYVKSL